MEYLKVKKLFSYLMLVLLLVALAVPMQMAGAQEPGTGADNLCFGAWADRCTVPGDQAVTEWMWTCGWYVARVEAGTLTPQWVIAHTSCDSLVNVPKAPYCINTYWGTSGLVDEVNGTVLGFVEHGCNGDTWVDYAWGSDYIGDWEGAIAYCQSQGSPWASAVAWAYPGAPENMWWC